MKFSTFFNRVCYSIIVPVPTDNLPISLVKLSTKQQFKTKILTNPTAFKTSPEPKALKK